MTSSNCFSRKKHWAMHCRPGMVSQCVCDAPKIWKFCCASLSCSALPVSWPMAALTTARRINSSGCVGCRSLSTPWASLNWPCLSHRARVTHKRQHNGSENTFHMQCPQMLGAQDTRFTLDHIDKKPNMQAPQRRCLLTSVRHRIRTWLRWKMQRFSRASGIVPTSGGNTCNSKNE